jgi:hypothetical protein
MMLMIFFFFSSFSFERKNLLNFPIYISFHSLNEELSFHLGESISLSCFNENIICVCLLHTVALMLYTDFTILGFINDKRAKAVV